jgi:tripartite-type tricarboxylate transporter receptor subunit TctC
VISEARRRLGLSALLVASSGHAAASSGLLLLPFLPSGPTEIVGTVPSSRIQRAMQSASGSALSDAVARAVARIAEGHLGHRLAVERMPAAGGQRAVEQMVGQSADSGSLLLASEALCVHAALERPALAALLDRLQPVASCVAVPYLLLHGAALADCVFGSAGHGGRSAALARSLAAQRRAGSAAPMCLEVAFNGGAAALQALLGGQIPMAVLPRALAGTWVERGVLRAEPVTSDTEGPPSDGWFGVFAPSSWVARRVTALGEALQAGFSDPVQQAWLERLGLRAMPESGSALGNRIREERDSLRDQKKRAGFSACPERGNRRGGGVCCLDSLAT